MSIKRMLLLVGLSVLFAGCSTSRFYGSNSTAYSDSSAKSMGVRYLLGRGVEQSNEKAFYYFNQAAKDGDPFAQNEIAYMYAAGKGTARDYSKAFDWYKKAAAQGLASAQYNVGLFYLHGLGTPADKSQARMWFQKSAAHGFEPARVALSR
ncbi:Localization factor PodJL [Aquicella siphonis]|uniref:Localization factor PodJL n=1 Tax=Aquicella siphonis TaxID=254247 RepID=A0A5E4PKJ0_9COXI|nr:tetratricopeptide repeat protein [Aquicella siphonis]VVC76853.1 Localization factor PodJL [Aquicella siphonis]